MKSKLLIITDYRGLYRQGYKRYKGIDLNILSKDLSEVFDIRVLTYNELLSGNLSDYSGYYIIYTSSQSEEYKRYIADILYQLNKNNILLPKYDIFLAHENKAFQELIKEESGIESLTWKYYSVYRDLTEEINDIKFPVVVKSVTGSGSRNVYLANDKKALLKTAKRICRKKDFVEYYLKIIYKLLTQRKKFDSEMLKEEPLIGRFILQEFVPNLKEDWKVLIFGNRYFVLNRKVRSKDFRASGSGKFSYEEVPVPILEYSKEVFDKLDVPFLSLDICMDDNGQCYLIEYQGVHFGPITLLWSDFHYVYHNGDWEKAERKADLASEYAYAIKQYYYENHT